MAEAVTTKEPEKSLWDRISETSADVANKALLVRRGVQQSIAGIPALPGYIVDLGNMGVKKLGASGYEGSAGGWIQGKVMQGIDAVEPDFLKPTIKTESDQKWADYTEVGTDVAMVIGTLGVGSVKLAGTGAKLAAKTAFKTAAKEGAESVAEAAAKSAAKTTAKVTIDDATAILAKAKAAGEAERAGVKVAAEAVEQTAKTAAKEGAEAAAETGAKAGLKAAGAKATTEAVENTSKSLLGTAMKFGSTAVAGAKVASVPLKIVGAPLLYPKTFWLGASAGHVMTGGASSEMIIGGYKGLWNLTSSAVPGAASYAADGALKLGDGFVGFVGTGAKMGLDGLGDYLPPGITPSSLRAVVGATADKTHQAASNATPSLSAQASEAFEGAKERTEDARADMGNFLEGESAKPFRNMLGKYLGMDPKDVDGKALVEVLKEKAKNEPAIGIGMALGAMSGMRSSSSKAEMAWKVPLYTALWGVAFMMLGPILNPLLKAFGGWASEKINDMKQSGGLTNQFHGAQVEPYANGALPSAVVQKQPVAEAANDPVMDFRSNGNAMTAPVADVGKLGVNTKAPAANRDLWAMTMNG